jgi:hypothetical protein
VSNDANAVRCPAGVLPACWGGGGVALLWSRGVRRRGLFCGISLWSFAVPIDRWILRLEFAVGLLS